MPRCVLTEAALADLRNLLNWCKLQGDPGAGACLAQALLDRIEQLEQFPLSGRQVPEFDQPSLRELIHPPYRIVYRLVGSAVQVVRIWRSERLLPEADQL
jgi:toxin ParE1/3/4